MPANNDSREYRRLLRIGVADHGVELGTGLPAIDRHLADPFSMSIKGAAAIVLETGWRPGRGREIRSYIFLATPALHRIAS